MDYHPKQVMVVDDDADLRTVISLVLKSKGYDVHEAENGQDALNQLKAWRPDLILLDLSMPTMDGLAFRRMQLEDPDVARIPTVLFTAAGSLKEEAKKLPFNGLLIKPFDLEDLMRTLDHA